MITIITTKKLKHLEKIERKHSEILNRLGECYRWFGFYTPLEGIWNFLNYNNHYIQNVRSEFRIRAAKFDWTKHDGVI